MTETNFKHTDLGLIPHDWEVKTIGDIAEYRRGSFPQPYGLPEWYGGVDAMPFVQVADVGDDFRLNQTTKQTISKKAQEYSVFVPKNSVLVTLQGSIGRVAITQYDSYVDRTLAIFQHYNIPMANNYFAHQLSKKFAIEREKAPGGIIKTITKEAFTEFELPLPPTLAEQERIAGALSSIDTLIGTLTEQIEKKRHIKQGAMQQLLTGKKRLAGFTGEWKTCKIKDIVGTIKRGQGLQSKDYVKGNIPVVAGGKQYAGYHNVANHLCNTITISGSGANAGYVALHTVPIFATDCSVIDEKDDFVLAFVYFVLLNKQSDIYKLQSGGAQPHIYPKNIEEIVALFPPTIAEQSAIAAVLSRMDAEIAALEQKRDKYIAIKSGMMQNLLTGKIRLV